jgi:hypothetical protein
LDCLALKLKVLQFFKMLVTTYPVTQYSIPDDLNLQQYHSENLKFRIILIQFDLCFFMLVFIHSFIHPFTLLFIYLLLTIHLLTYLLIHMLTHSLHLFIYLNIVYLFIYLNIISWVKNRVLHPLASGSCSAQPFIII